MRQPFRKKIETWTYQNDLELINAPSRKSQDFFIMQSLFGAIIMILTGGQFLAGFAIYLGASDNLVGYISLISSISGILLIFSGLLLERFSTRKRLVIILNSIAKPLMASVVLIPILVPKAMQVPALLITLSIAYALNSLMSIAINNWFVHVIPIRIRGRYYAVRQSYAVIVSAIVPIIAGRIMDTASDQYIGFVIIYLWAFISIFGENYAFSKIDDVKIDTTDKDKLKLGDVFRIPIKNKEFMAYTFKLMAFYFTLYMSASLIQVYMLRYLGLSYTFISAMTVLSSIVQIFVYPRWGRLGDIYGQELVMDISIWGYALHMGLWALVSKGNVYVFSTMAHLVGAICGAGFAVGSFNSRYEIIPEKGGTIYEGFYTAIIGLTLLVAPWVGSRIRKEIINIEYIQSHIAFGELRILFAISAIGLALLQLYDVVKKRIKDAKV